MVCVRQKLLRAVCAVFTVFFIVLMLSASRGRSPLDSGSSSPLKRLPGRAGKREQLLSQNDPFLEEANFTLVIQTYKRNDLLHRLLSHYCKFDAVDRIIIVWNNVNESVPDFLHYLPCGPQLFYLKQRENTIRNRFQPFPQIRTEGRCMHSTSVQCGACVSIHVCVCVFARVCVCRCVMPIPTKL